MRLFSLNLTRQRETRMRVRMGSNFPRIALVAAICLLSLETCLSIADSSNSTTTTTTTTKKPITSYPISTTTKAASESITSSTITPGQPARKLFDFTRKAGPKFGLRRSLECKYDKGPWEECKDNGEYHFRLAITRLEIQNANRN